MGCECNRPLRAGCEPPEVHHLSDLDFTMRLWGRDGEPLGFPAHPFCMEFRSGLTAQRVVARSGGGSTVNCADDGNGGIRVTLKDHKLHTGDLVCRLTQWVPDAGFPSGVRTVVDEFPAGLRLTNRATAVAVPVAVDVHLASVEAARTIDPEELVALRDAVGANTAAISVVARGLSDALDVRPATLRFGRVVDDTDPAFPTDGSGDGTVEEMPRMTQVGGGIIGAIGGGQIQPDPSLTLDPLLGTPHYHAGRQRFVTLEKTVTPAPLDEDDDTGADPAQRLIVSGEFDGDLPEGWMMDDPGEAGLNHDSGGTVLTPGQSLATMAEWDGHTPVLTARVRGDVGAMSRLSGCTFVVATFDGETLTALPFWGNAVLVGDTEEAGSPLAGTSWTVGTWLLRIPLPEDFVKGHTTGPVSLVAGLATSEWANALVRSLALYSGWLFTALGGKRPDTVGYAWNDEAGPLNEQVTDDSGTRWQPRTDVAYADSAGARYTALRTPTVEEVTEPMPDGGGWQTVVRTRIDTALMASPVIPAAVNTAPDISLSLRNADDMAAVFTCRRISASVTPVPGMTEEETVANTKAEIERLFPSPEEGMTLIEGVSLTSPVLWVYGPHLDGMSFVTGWHRATAATVASAYLVPVAMGTGMRRLSPGLYTYDAVTDTLVRYTPQTLTENNPADLTADMSGLLRETGFTK